MRRYILSLLVISTFFACRKEETTSPTPTPKYSIKAGDSWLFLRTRNNTTDTTKVIARPETIINNIKFHPFFDTTLQINIAYINASDSIIMASSYTFGNKTYYIISRLIRQTVNKGDSWTDSTIIKPDTIVIKVITKVDSVDVQESVPAGTFTINQIKQEYWYIHRGMTPPEGIKYMEIKFYINENPIFVRARTNTYYPNNSVQDEKLIKYTRGQ
ncbi:MAG: hypothetical protein RMJ38_06585 [candidate division WOR-3 bacterium]|nr:hypothetical protein [candidate division WOR-3 bacterium]MDW8151088.1 hypothetical protein [candidate division WOR-3 bacterium]